MKRSLAVLLSVLPVLCPASLQAAVTVLLGTDPAKSVIEGKFVTPDQVINGRLVIDGDTISCIGTSCTEPLGATRITISNAFVYPGFIDAHNHVAYNVLPRWNPPKIYQSRSQWQSAKSYKDFKAPYDNAKPTLLCEMTKYGEIKALLSGVTTIQGSPERQCIKTLIRNAESQNELGTSSTHIRTYILDIRNFQDTVDWSKTKSFVVHIGEGLTDDAREELAILKQKGLLTDKTAIIHGTSFGAAEFDEMAKAKAKLIWSPQSNLALYDKTTNIKLAYDRRIDISLSVDWNLTGSDNLFDELRVAAAINHDDFGNVIPDSDWIKLITMNPARALALDDKIGQLSSGHKADITVVSEKNADPNQNLLSARLGDVQMVWVSGDALYGADTAIETLKPGQCEPLTVYGLRKRVCVKDTKNPVEGSDETLAVIRNRLETKIPSLAPLTP